MSQVLRLPLARWESNHALRIQAVALPALAYVLSGAYIGWMAWGTTAAISRLLWIVLLPVIWGMASTRGRATLVMAGYYLAAARALPNASSAFFGDAAPWWLGWGLWAAAGVLLTVPFAILWSSRRTVRPLRFVLAVCVSILTPLGVISWTNVLSVAGVVFPGTSWVGLVLMLLAFGVLVERKPRWMITLGAASLVANCLVGENRTETPEHWRGVDTHFPQIGSDGSYDAGQLLLALRRLDWIKKFADSVPANSVHVLPETVLGPVNGVTEFALNGVNTALRAKNARILIGAELPKADGRYLNTLTVLGATDGEQRIAVQGIPVPVGMWQPWSSKGADANVYGSSNVVTVQGTRVGVLICYEQALPLRFLRTMLQQPELIIGVSNVWWAKVPDVPNIQSQTLMAFSRLFGLPVITAANW